jgi:hypothetical protein
MANLHLLGQPNTFFCYRVAAPARRTLTPAEKAAFRRDGFVHCAGWFSAEEVGGLGLGARIVTLYYNTPIPYQIHEYIRCYLYF